MKEKERLIFDRRLVERNLAKGIISKKDLEKKLASLPDVSEKVEKLGGDEKTDGDQKKDVRQSSK